MWEICQISLSRIISMHLLLWISDKRITSYKFRVTSNYFFTSHSLLFIYEWRVTIYCTSYEKRYAYELQVTIYCTSYKLNLSYELQIIIYCTNWDCNVDCVKFIHYTSYSVAWLALYKIKYSLPAIPEQCISWVSAPTLN